MSSLNIYKSSEILNEYSFNILSIKFSYELFSTLNNSFFEELKSNFIFVLLTSANLMLFISLFNITLIIELESYLKL